jgi:hypothetical protein
MPREMARKTLSENELVQNAQVLAYVAAIVMSWVLFRGRIWDKRHIGWIFLVVLALRELDFHNNFTKISIFCTRFYLSLAVPLTEKLTVAGILLILLSLSIKFTLDNWESFICSLKARNADAISLLFAILLLPVSVVIDKTPGAMERVVGLRLGIDIKFAFLVLEETLELASPILFFIALLQWRKVAGK